MDRRRSLGGPRQLVYSSLMEKMPLSTKASYLRRSSRLDQLRFVKEPAENHFSPWKEFGFVTHICHLKIAVCSGLVQGCVKSVVDGVDTAAVWYRRKDAYALGTVISHCQMHCRLIVIAHAAADIIAQSSEKGERIEVCSEQCCTESGSTSSSLKQSGHLCVP